MGHLCDVVNVTTRIPNKGVYIVQQQQFLIKEFISRNTCVLAFLVHTGSCCGFLFVYCLICSVLNPIFVDVHQMIPVLLYPCVSTITFRSLGMVPV
jgi:hypothetical protein